MSQSDPSNIKHLITDHIDIWTSAILSKPTSGRGSNKKYELYGISKLRELILELAVRGKLVAQDPNDEPASVLLEKIAAEKAELIKEGKIKKSKPLADISEDEIPFELPQGWEWARLKNIGHDLGQKKPDVDFTYIDVGSINKELGLIENAKIVSAEEAPSRARKLVKKGTVLYSTVRPYLLNIAVVDKDFFPEPIASTAFAIIYPLKGVSSSFVYRYLRSPSFVNYVENCQTGIAYPAINDKQFFSGLIPLPPREEQYRIVAKVDELMQLCDDLEQQTEASIDAHATLVEVLLTTLTDSADADELTKNWTRISEHFDSLFTTEQSIEALKQTVLQLAVMGKLVPQDPNDKPASVLLEKIAEEKARLIQERQIKRDKPLAKINKNETPFELPQSWTWCRLQDIGHDWGQKKPDIDFTYIDVGSINKELGLIEDAKIVSAEEAPSRARKLVKKGTVIYSTVRPYLLNIAVVDKYFSPEPIASTAFAIIHPLKGVSSSFVYRYLRSPTFISYVENCQTGIAYPAINDKQFFNGLIPIPPLAEQHRIVTKVDELMQICDQLKDRLQQSQTTQVQLTDALIEQALA